VEPLRWYYHCDRLGMIVWQDMPSGGAEVDIKAAFVLQVLGITQKDTLLLNRFGRADKANQAAFRAELQGMVDHLYNSPCIAVWVPFNEAWGQFHARDISCWLHVYDPTRLVDHASGWYDQAAGDFQSKHIYFKKCTRPRPDDRIFVISEFGGYSLLIPGHAWDETQKFGYRSFDTPDELTAAYLALLESEIGPLIPQGLAAAIYTQTTDVESEINGYLTYDRKVAKMDIPSIRAAHEKLIRAGSQ
jgi:hypothetical protein